MKVIKPRTKAYPGHNILFPMLISASMPRMQFSRLVSGTTSNPDLMIDFGGVRHAILVVTYINECYAERRKAPVKIGVRRLSEDTTQLSLVKGER